MMNNNKLPIPPQPWTIVSDNMGRQFYYNPLTQQQSWTPPPGSQPIVIQPQSQQPMMMPQFNIPMSSSMSNKSLPDGWEESTDAQGRVYYIDHINKKTSWIHPSFSHSLQQQPTVTESKPTTSNTQSSSSNNNNISTSPPSSDNSSFYPSFTEYGYGNNNSSTSTTNVNKPTSTTASSTSDDSYRPRNFSSPPVKVQPTTTSYINNPTPTTSTSSSTGGTSVSNGGSAGSKSNVLLSHISPLWDLEKLVPSCSNCYSPFTVIKRRHHCRCCYREFCDACSTKRIKIPQFNYNDAVRVCEYCFSHQSSNEKTCISRLIPYLFENYKNTHQQYQALLEIYDYVLTYQNYPASIESAIVGGLKPFLEYSTRATRQGEKGETVALCCQIMAFTSKYEKVLKSIADKENLVALFDLLHATENSSVQIDTAKVIKEILITMAKKKSATAATNSTATTATNTSATTNTTTATTNTSPNGTTPVVVNNEPMIPNSIITQFIGTLDQQNIKNKEDYQIEALKIMKRLVQDENTAIALGQSGAIEVTTPLLSSNKQGILRRVLKLLLTFIEYDAKNSEKIFALGGALFLAELLSKQISPNYNIYILTILNEISKTKYCNNITEIEGLVDLLLEPFNSNINSKEFKELLLLINHLLLATTNTALINKISTHPQFIQSVIQALMVGSLEQSASQCLLCLSQGEKVKEKLRDLGVIDPLLSIICDKSKNPIGPLKILTQLAKNNETICNNIFEVGGLTVLIDIITTPAPKPIPQPPKPIEQPKVPYADIIEATNTTTSNNGQVVDENEKKIQEFKSVQFQAVKLLSILSYSKNIIREFVHFENGNGVKTLVSLMNPTCDDQIKEVASESLCNLCENETCAILVISEGGLTYAQALLSSNQTHIKANTLKLIQKLATHSPDIKIAISEGTSIQKIVEMLSNSNPELKKCAIFSLAELCRENSSNRDLAYKCGCLPHLVSSFNSYTNDTKTLVCVLEVLAGYSQQSDQYRAILLNTDIVQSIIEYLFSSVPSSSSSQSMNSSSDSTSNQQSFIIQSQVYSVLILSNLIKENSNDLIRKVIDSGIILSLIPMLAIKNSYLQEYTLNTLKIISKSTTPEIRETMIFSGILNSLSDLLFSKNESILNNSLYILVQLSQSQDCGGYLLSTNAVTQISELVISQSTSEPVKKLAIQLISTLFETSSNNSSIWETFTSKAGIPGLISLLSSNNSSLAISAASALSQIVVDGPGRARVVENGGLPLLLKAMSSDNIDVACASLVTVLGLSLEDELCEMIVNLGALKILEQMLTLKTYMENKISIDTKLYACETIFNLASNSQCKLRICEDNQIIISIIQLLFSNVDSYVAVACKTFALIINDANIAKFVSEQGVIFCLAPLFSNANVDINTKISSSVALSNLAKLYHPSRNDIIDTVDENNEYCLSSIISVLSKPLTKSNDPSQSAAITLDIRLKLQILELLELLSDEPKFPEIVEKSKGISTIVSLLSNIIESEKPSTQEEITCYTTLLFKTLTIIAYLTNNVSTREILLKNDCLKQLGSIMTPPPETLISLDDSKDLTGGLSILDLQEKTTTSKSTPTSNILTFITSSDEKEELNKLSLNLIYTLSLSEEGKHAIRNSKLINTVSRFIESKIQDQSCIALRTVSLLSLSSLNRLEIYNNGGLDKVLNLFKKSDINPNVLLNCLYAIYNSIFLEQSHSSFIQKDCLETLVNCTLYQNETIQHQTILIINRHFNHSKYVEQLVEKYDIITRLVNILNTASSESLILYVLKTLNDFIPFDCARVSITSKIPIQILKTLQNVNNPTLRELSSSILELFTSNSNLLSNQ